MRAVDLHADLLRASIASRGQRSSPGRQRGPAGDHLHLSGRHAQRHSRAAGGGRSEDHQEGRLAGPGRQDAAADSPAQRRPQPHEPLRLHRQQVRVPRRGLQRHGGVAQHGAQHDHRREPGLTWPPSSRRTPARTPSGREAGGGRQVAAQDDLLKKHAAWSSTATTTRRQWHKEAAKRGLPNLRVHTRSPARPASRRRRWTCSTSTACSTIASWKRAVEVLYETYDKTCWRSRPGRWSRCCASRFCPRPSAPDGARGDRRVPTGRRCRAARKPKHSCEPS